MIDSLSAATLGTKLIVLGVIVAFVFGGGVACGLKWDAGEVADANAAKQAAERDRDGWMATANDMRAAAKAQSDKVREAREIAEKAKRNAEAAVAEANKAADKFLDRLAELNRKAEADKLKCNEERARICGAPLR